MSMDKLKDIQARQAKVPAGKKQVKLSDGGGMYLLVTQTGKCWRFDYRFAGKRLTLALGMYPDVSLTEARKKHKEAREQVAAGIDPSMQKKATKQAEDGTFEAVAREWFEKQRTVWKPGHAVTVMSRLENNVFPWLGNRSMMEIEPPDLLAVLRRIESRGAIETAHRVKSICGQVFRYAVATGQAKRDPVPDLKGALTPVQSVSMATITDPKRVGELLRAMQGYAGTFSVKCALLI
ncbi:MAG: integrase arm-type DNA-binding domain-containing protein, partial [Mariprofundaceae bacterium]|nr:integrase arm-type DNA-binding domain-containing protein [Mariprofundaceae bacterium]